VNHYENFPVASVLCPPALRPAVAAIYWFARTADDLADEGDATATQRLADLAAYRADLDAVLAGRDPGLRWTPVFAALSRAQRQHGFPPALLHDLLNAFEQDVHNPGYADRTALLDYCRQSANPVGRLLLHLYGVQRTPDLEQSDAICSSLQLINFWQDLGLDQRRGRNYLPVQDLAVHGVRLTAGRPAADSPGLRAAVRNLCEWARGLMGQGAPLACRLPGRAGWELRLVVQGGLRILDKIAGMDHDTLNARPTLGKRDLPTLLWRAVCMTREPVR
jgi:squalene synthase HpnC